MNACKLTCKKLFSILMVIAMLASIAACKGGGGESSGTSSGASNGSQSSDESVPSEAGTDGGGESTAGTSSVSGASTGNRSTSASSATTKKPNSSGNTSRSRDDVMKSMPSNLKGKTLTYFYWWDPKKQMEKEAIAAFEKATGVTVKTEVGSYWEFQSELNAKIAAGKAPDLIRMLGNELWMMQNIQPLSASKFDFSDSAWDDWIMSQYTFNGEAFATNLKNSAVLDPYMVYYNKKALKAAGMEDPYKIWKNNPKKWTWDKFWSMCDEFLKANNNKSGYYGALPIYYWAVMRSMGGSLCYYDAAQGKYVSGMQKPETIAGITKTLEAYSKNWLVPPGSGFSRADFGRGRALFLLNGPFSARTRDEQEKSLKNTGDLGTVPMPTDSKGTLLYEMTAFAIPKGAKNPELAPYYIRYVMDQKSYDMSKVFYDAQSLEVYNYTIGKRNFWYGHHENSELYKSLVSAGASQVKSVLNTYSPVIAASVDKYNQRIPFLGK